MDYAHYNALSEADWLAVKQERLMLDMPLTINWDHMDARLLERFFARRPQRAHNLYRYVPVPLDSCRFPPSTSGLLLQLYLQSHADMPNASSCRWDSHAVPCSLSGLHSSWQRQLHIHWVPGRCLESVPQPCTSSTLLQPLV